jgi:type IV secretory pathway component VirB8
LIGGSFEGNYTGAMKILTQLSSSIHQDEAVIASSSEAISVVI